MRRTTDRGKRDRVLLDFKDKLQINSLAAQIFILPRRIVNLLFDLVHHPEYSCGTAQALYLPDHVGRDPAQCLFHVSFRTKHLFLHVPRGKSHP